MRLVTHNMLKCNIKGMDDGEGYPLIVEANTTEIIEQEKNIGLIKHILLLNRFINCILEILEAIKKILKILNWNAVKSAAKNLSLTGKFEGLESVDIEAVENDESLMQEIHHLLFEVHVTSGWLICPSTGRKFPIKDGIPNMLLHEDEI